MKILPIKGCVDYLPKERNNTLRLGLFGIVKDDESSAFPRIVDNFFESLPNLEVNSILVF